MGSIVFLGGHKAGFLPIEQNVVVAIDLFTDGKELNLQLRPVGSGRGLFQLGGKNIIDNFRNVCCTTGKRTQLELALRS